MQKTLQQYMWIKHGMPKIDKILIPEENITQGTLKNFSKVFYAVE